ncbi:MAG TPA: GNAT family N-acetyltransferase [Lachnospiraceae bacterium]|nr:GNAT family N-acetyltransferase [Lachnospiraceae bacterium]
MDSKLVIRDMETKDREQVLALEDLFYHSDAVCHPVDPTVWERCFDAAIEGTSTLRGLILEAEGEIAGYAYITTFFATEVGGLCQMIEQIYIKDGYRGKGYGSRLIGWLEQEYPDVRRMRLEVTEENPAAIRLYKKMGYEFLGYLQMVKEQSV